MCQKANIKDEHLNKTHPQSIVGEDAYNGNIRIWGKRQKFFEIMMNQAITVGK